MRKGTHHTPETAQKIREAHLGRKHSEEHKKKISEGGKGKKRSEETKAKISAGNMGKTHTVEARQKMSETRKGRPAPWVSERLKGVPRPATPAVIAANQANNLKRKQPEDVRKAARAASCRSSTIKRRYGITVEDYDRLLESQDGVCAICKKSCTTGKRLAVDHNHTTGKVRGLLCRKCNRGVGHFDDDYSLMQRAVLYLAEN